MRYFEAIGLKNSNNWQRKIQWFRYQKYEFPKVLVQIARDRRVYASKNGGSDHPSRRFELYFVTAIEEIRYYSTSSMSRVNGSMTFVLRSMARTVVRCSVPSRLDAITGNT